MTYQHKLLQNKQKKKYEWYTVQMLQSCYSYTVEVIKSNQAIKDNIDLTKL